MKKITLFITLITLIGNTRAQNLMADFETFTLQANSYYKDTNSVWFETGNVSFMYEWTKGMYPYWSGGFSYTNKYDSTTAGFTNLYGVKPYKGQGGSDKYLVGQNYAKIRLKAPQTTVQGFYYTNTTYAYKSIKNGDSFSRKFGDTTGTGAGNTIAQGSYPDYFKLIVRGYRNGTLLTDSVEIYLADYRSSNNSLDYVVNDWRYANTATLGVVDSLVFLMRSSDYDQYGMLTPGFFGLDNFVTSSSAYAGVGEMNAEEKINVYPNPFKDQIIVQTAGQTHLTIKDLKGIEVFNQYIDSEEKVNLSFLNAGVYILVSESGEGKSYRKLIKE